MIPGARSRRRPMETQTRTGNLRYALSSLYTSNSLSVFRALRHPTQQRNVCLGTASVLVRNLFPITCYSDLITSHATGKGLYAAIDSVVMFLPLQSITTGRRVSALLDLFDEEFSHVDRTGIKALQYPIQRAWIEEGQVAHSIGALWGRGFIEPSANDSYIVLVGGIAVRSFLRISKSHIHSRRVQHPTSRGSVVWLSYLEVYSLFIYA